MATTTLVRYWWRHRRCNYGSVVNLFGLNVRLQPEAHDAGRALEQTLLAEDYGIPTVLGSTRRCPAGISGKTCQSNGKNCSLHNYVLALDFDPFGYGNPHLYRSFEANDWGKTKFTPAQVAAVEDIRTNNGKQPWRWLGWSIGDTMHWQINCSPADLATGIDWSTVPNNPEEEENVLQNGDQGDAVGRLQQALINWNEDALPVWGADKDFGDETQEWVGNYQAAADLTVTGKADGVTMALLMEYMPDHASSGGDTKDDTARAAAAEARQIADQANARLDNLKESI